MNKFPKISIIFPNFNGGKEPLECLKSVTKTDYPKSKLEIMVIDNASSDGSNRKIKKSFPEVSLLQQTENLGFAKAVNLGIKKSTGEFLLITNDDILIDRNGIKKLVNYAQNHPETGCLTGKIFSKQHPDNLAVGGCKFNYISGNINLFYKPDITHEPDWAAGCAMFIPRQVLNLTGLFDTAFPHFFEDFDLCLRIRKSGYKIIYLPDVIFWHGQSTTGNRNKPDKYYKWYQSKIRFMLKNLHWLNFILMMTLQLFLVIPYRTLVLKDGRLIPFLRAVWWNLYNLPESLSARSHA